MTKQSNTANDICNSIRSSESIDPFEGLDLEDICVPPPQVDPSAATTKDKQQSKELFDLNPFDGIDLKDISIAPDDMPSPHVEETSGKHYVSQSIDEEKVNFVIIPRDDTAEEIEAERRKYKRPDRSLSRDVALPPAKVQKNPVHPIIEKAYHYAELTQIRQKVFAALEESGGKTLLIASPLDNTGSTLLAAALAYNAACSCQQNVLLIDCNMRRAGLHDFFYVPQSYGFTDLIRSNLPWQAVVKESSIAGLSIITAGDPIEEFSDHLHYAHIPKLVENIFS